MNFPERLSASKGLILIVVVGVVLFFAGFWLSRSSASAAKAESQAMRYQFMQIGDSVAAIDVYTGESYAIDGNARAWVLLAPALPTKEAKPVR